jgi:hypothetical protein
MVQVVANMLGRCEMAAFVVNHTCNLALTFPSTRYAEAKQGKTITCMHHV